MKRTARRLHGSLSYSYSSNSSFNNSIKITSGTSSSYAGNCNSTFHKYRHPIESRLLQRWNPLLSLITALKILELLLLRCTLANRVERPR